jgi:hypothetical protein
MTVKITHIIVMILNILDLFSKFSILAFMKRYSICFFLLFISCSEPSINLELNRLLKAHIFIQKITNDSIITKTIIKGQMDSLMIDSNKYYKYKENFDNSLDFRKEVLKSMLIVSDSIGESEYFRILYHKSMHFKDSLYQK